MSHLCAKLGETAPTWGKLVAPWAEYVARTLWASTSPSKSERRLSTPLKQQHRREAKGRVQPPKVFAPRPQRVCHGCEAVLGGNQAEYCAPCGGDSSRANMNEVAQRQTGLRRRRESAVNRHREAKNHCACSRLYLRVLNNGQAENTNTARYTLLVEGL